MTSSAGLNWNNILRRGQRLFLLAGTIVLTAATAAAEKKPDPAFGDAVQLAPFVVNGKKLSISIHARTPSDRGYAEKFAEEVVGIAYETLGKSTGAGLVIVGREGEPHPVVVMRKFLALAAAGQLDPAVATKAGELTARMADSKAMYNLDQPPDGEKGFKLTFDLLLPALPLPLEGMASKLYQLSWAEGFDDARIEQKLRALTLADLAGDALSKYDWVFYLPPRNAFKGVEDEVIKQAVQHEKMGLFRRAALKSALFVFQPAVRTAVEGMRKGILFMTVLRAESDYSKDDIKHLTITYTNVLMPDFKFNGGTEHKRALEAIEAQKVRNTEYAKDPFVSPARLAAFDPAVYAAFEGEYSEGEGKGKGKTPPTWSFKRKDEAYLWQYMEHSPLTLHPAGERLLVTADGRMTIQFQVDEQGAVTGAEERGVRYRRTFPRKVEVAKDQAGSRQQ